MKARALIIVALIAAMAGSGACSNDDGEGMQASGPTDAGGRPAGAGTGAPTDSGTATEELVSAEALTALAELSPETLPTPPADASNRYADDPAAAALGQRLFFDPGFAGPLLDEDNNGGVGTLGRVGDTGKVSCRDCHEPSRAFADVRSSRRQVSLGAAWGRRRAPALLDVAHAKLLMWDGRRDAGYNQVLAAIESGVEVNGSRLFLAQQIYARYRDDYDAVFKDEPIAIPLDDAARFPQLDGSTTGCRELHLDQDGVARTADCHGVPGDGAEYDGLAEADKVAVTRIAVNVGKAISAYTRLLACGPSRFDEWMHGKEDALSEAEQRGAALFVGQRSGGRMVSGCNSCHSGPFMSDQQFHNVGMEPVGVGIAASFYDREDHGARDGLAGALADPLNVRGMFSDGDDGRLPDEVAERMNGSFRTPTLRCVAMRPTFMHNGQIGTLDDLLVFFDNGGDKEGYHGVNELTPQGFTADERADIVAFLKALNGPGPAKALLAKPEP